MQYLRILFSSFAEEDLFCSKKVNVMGKGKNWGFLQKFEIYRNDELLHRSHVGDDSSIRKRHYSLIYGPINLKFDSLA